jgi:hypothetical protein
LLFEASIRLLLVIAVTALVAAFAGCGSDDTKERVAAAGAAESAQVSSAPQAGAGAPASEPPKTAPTREAKGGAASSRQAPSPTRATQAEPTAAPSEGGVDSGGAGGSESKPPRGGGSHGKGSGVKTPTGGGAASGQADGDDGAPYGRARKICSDPNVVGLLPEEDRQDPEKVARFVSGLVPPEDAQPSYDGCLDGLRSLGL